MKINLNDGSFYCFGCGVTGTALNFVMLVNKDKKDDLQACIEYHKILKSKKVSSIKIVSQKKNHNINKQALIEAHDYFYGLKTIDWKKDRQEEAKECAKYMKDRGFLASTLNKCKAKVTYNKSYPIVFPMLDNKEFRGWVCRTMNSTIEQKRKYLYNEGFSRRNTLVGNYNHHTIFVVEGYMDYLKMKQNGAKYVAAILGWKITEQQIKKLKQNGVKTIISALDNDICGKKGTKELGKHFKVIKLPYPKHVKDPGDMNKKVFDSIINKIKKEVCTNEFSK